MAELANEAFIKYMGTKLTFRIADSLRVSARLPYPTIWVEYSLRAYQKRASEIRAIDNPTPPHELPMREGWLLQQHPLIDTAIILHIFTEADEPDDQGYTLWTFPFTFAWSCDDSPLPWWTTMKEGPPDETLMNQMSEKVVGLSGYKRENVGIVNSPLILGPSDNPRLTQTYRTLLNEWAGCVRRVWALLA